MSNHQIQCEIKKKEYFHSDILSVLINPINVCIFIQSKTQKKIFQINVIKWKKTLCVFFVSSNECKLINWSWKKRKLLWSLLLLFPPLRVYCEGKYWFHTARNTATYCARIYDEYHFLNTSYRPYLGGLAKVWNLYRRYVQFLLIRLRFIQNYYRLQHNIHTDKLSTRRFGMLASSFKTTQFDYFFQR